ncbi:MAG: ABC transporter substrate-binding protein [Dehalococcoidia bacterium]
MRKKRLSKWMLLASAVMVVVLVAAACGGEEEEEAAVAPTATSPAPTATSVTEEKGLIRIAENDWTGNFVDINLAKIILEEEMGYDVELIFADYTAQWVALEAGDLDVVMEIWPSYSIGQMEEFLAEEGGSGSVVSQEPMGIIGTTGYWVFTYVIEGDPERGIEATAPDLVDWTDLNQYKDLFKTPESGDKGRWVGAPVVGWAAHDEERVANLGLEYEHVYLGSEAALFAEIDSYYTRGEPLLFYMWAPHWIPAKYEITRIPLPAYTDECWGYVEGVDPTFACDFPTDITFNIANPDWIEENPEAAQFFRNFNLSNDDQNKMILAVDIDEVPIEQAVRQWMAENEDIWTAWIPFLGLDSGS